MMGAAKKFSIFLIFMIVKLALANDLRREAESACETARVKVADMNDRKYEVTMVLTLFNAWKQGVEELKNKNFQEAKRICEVVIRHSR